MDSGGLLRVYRRQGGVWQEERSMPLRLVPGGGLAGLRQQMAAVITFLGGCRVVVAASITGVPYYELEKAGCSLWEMQGQPLDWLEEVLHGEEENANIRPTPVALPVPQDLGDGRWRISIREVQQAAGGITSKQVLQKLLRRGDFSTLEILCAHVPPWLEGEWLAGSFGGTKERLANGDWLVRIQRTTAQE